MNNNNRLLALEKKDISARFDAAIKAYFDWKSATETDDEIIADLRLAYPEMDDSNSVSYTHLTLPTNREV